MRLQRTRVLPFGDPALKEDAILGRVHPDGSIFFRGREYRSIREVPPDCLALRPDSATLAQWRRLYAAVDPRKR